MNRKSRGFFVCSRDIQSDNGKAPEWIVLFRAGWNELEGEGKYFVDEESFASVCAQVARRGNDIVIDYEHQTLKDIQAPAAGWIKEFRWDPAKGILAKVEWTEKGGAYVASKEYRYFSPVFYVRESDQRLIALDSVALTNLPKTNNLTPILAKLDGVPPVATDMEDGMEFLRKLAAKIGMGEDATEDQVLAVVASLKDKKPEVKETIPAEVLKALDLETGDTSTVVASIHAAKQTSKTMVSREEFQKLQNQLAERDAQEVVAKAMSDGKVTPDQKEWAEGYAKADIEGFKTFVAKAPVVVPVTPLPGKALEKKDVVTDEAVLAVAKQMDVDVEDIKKYGGVE